jgi:hypothetical protein
MPGSVDRCCGRVGAGSSFFGSASWFVRMSESLATETSSRHTYLRHLPWRAACLPRAGVRLR